MAGAPRRQRPPGTGRHLPLPLPATSPAFALEATGGQAVAARLGAYLSFNDARARAANIAPSSQNRTTVCVSVHPPN